jgi:hypothetical protein
MQAMSHFEEVLEVVEALPLDDQEILVELVRQRVADKRRAEIARNIADTRAEYQTGQVQRGFVADRMSELGMMMG